MIVNFIVFFQKKSSKLNFTSCKDMVFLLRKQRFCILIFPKNKFNSICRILFLVKGHCFLDVYAKINMQTKHDVVQFVLGIMMEKVTS